MIVKNPHSLTLISDADDMLVATLLTLSFAYDSRTDPPNPRPPPCAPIGSFCGGAYPSCCSGECAPGPMPRSNTCQTRLQKDAPVQATPNFCADVQQWIVNSTASGGPIPKKTSWPPGSKSYLCMTLGEDGAKYTRRGVVRNGVTNTTFEMWAIFNGTDSFALTVNSSAPGGWNCVRRVIGPPADPTAKEPWAYATIDAEAMSDGTEPEFDGVKSVARWRHDRPSRGSVAGGNMTWRVDQSGPVRLLRTSFLQMQHHTGLNQSGERDFAANFTTSLPSSWNPPPDVVCHLPPNAYLPANDCKPACGAGSPCCKDPLAPAGTADACYSVADCAMLPGPPGPGAANVREQVEASYGGSSFWDVWA
jgi:hypothetical protein